MEKYKYACFIHFTPLIYLVRGKVVIVVNVASECGLTKKNYSQLQELHEKYNNQGLVILAFPCNQFGGQVVFGLYFLRFLVRLSNLVILFVCRNRVAVARLRIT